MWSDHEANLPSKLGSSYTRFQAWGGVLRSFNDQCGSTWWLFKEGKLIKWRAVHEDSYLWRRSNQDSRRSLYLYECNLVVMWRVVRALNTTRRLCERESDQDQFKRVQEVLVMCKWVLITLASHWGHDPGSLCLWGWYQDTKTHWPIPRPWRLYSFSLIGVLSQKGFSLMRFLMRETLQGSKLD